MGRQCDVCATGVGFICPVQLPGSDIFLELRSDESTVRFISKKKNEPQWLLGDPSEPFGDSIAVAGTPLTGRWINSSEVFEVLR